MYIIKRKKLVRAGHAPSFQVKPWNMPYNCGKSTKKPQGIRKVPEIQAVVVI
jgi:hypothetical protein